DAAGLTSISASRTITIDTVAPTVVAVGLTNGGTSKTADEDDFVTVTFSESLAVATLCPSWVGDDVDQFGDKISVTATVANFGADDRFQIVDSECIGGLNVGAVRLGGDYVSGNAVYHGSGGHSSWLRWSASTHALTLSLGSITSATAGFVRTNVTAG